MQYYMCLHSLPNLHPRGYYPNISCLHNTVLHFVILNYSRSLGLGGVFAELTVMYCEVRPVVHAVLEGPDNAVDTQWSVEPGRQRLRLGWHSVRQVLTTQMYTIVTCQKIQINGIRKYYSQNDTLIHRCITA